MRFRTAFQVNSGLGAGNIADDLAMQGFYRHLPNGFRLHAGVFENFALRREPFPEHVATHVHRADRIENAWVDDIPGLLAGAGSIFDRPGEAWPLGFLAPRLQHFHDRGLPVDAVGVTVEPLTTPEGQCLFRKHFLPIRSWSVCDSSSREALLALGVDPVRIRMGGDWVWLCEAATDCREWATGVWRSLGVDLARPLLAVNIFCPAATEPEPIFGPLAKALDRLQREDGYQVGFVCFDFRHPGFHRSAAEPVQALMETASVLVPNEYYGPGEVIALLGQASAVVARSYPCGVAAILGGSRPVFLANRPAGAERCEELGLAPCGSYGRLDCGEVMAAVRAVAAGEPLTGLREKQAERARENLRVFELFG